MSAARGLRILLGLAIVLGVAGVAFLAGRFSAPSARFEATAVAPGDSPVDAAFDDFLRAQAEARARLRAHPFAESPIERAEVDRVLLYGLNGALATAAFAEPDEQLMPAAHLTTKAGLDNPDNLYFIAYVHHDRAYRIRGQRGSAATLSFQLVRGIPGADGKGALDQVSALSHSQLRLEDGGEFEIVLAPERPPNTPNWLSSEEGARTLLVRFSHSDWAAELPGWVELERIDARSPVRGPLDDAAMAAALSGAARSLFDRTATWTRFAERLWDGVPRNRITPVRASDQGLRSQSSAFGTFEIGDDEALIVTTHPSRAPYQGLQLGNRWFVSLDYVDHTSSLTAAQAYESSDGLLHFVISLRDPGVQNWLDPVGHRRGLMMLRWQGLEGEVERQPSTQLVSFAALRDALPPDTPAFGAEARAAQIEARRRHVRRRFGAARPRDPK